MNLDSLSRKVNGRLNLRFDFESRSTSLQRPLGGPVVQWIEQWFPVP